MFVKQANKMNEKINNTVKCIQLFAISNHSQPIDFQFQAEHQPPMTYSTVYSSMSLCKALKSNIPLQFTVYNFLP